MVHFYMELYRLRNWYISNMEILYIFFFPFLDGSASMLRPKLSMNFLYSVLFTVKMGSIFPLFSATSLAVSKTHPAVIGSSRKICDILPLLSTIVLYHHILALSRLS